MSFLARWGDWVDAELLPVFRRKSETQDRDHRSLTKPSPISCGLTGITLHEDPPPFNNFFHLETRLPAEKPLAKLLRFGIPAIPLFGEELRGGQGPELQSPQSPLSPAPAPALPPLKWPSPSALHASVSERLRHPLHIMLWEGGLGSLGQRSEPLNALSARRNIRQEKSRPVLKPRSWW